MAKLDWIRADSHLSACERIYFMVGDVAAKARDRVIGPCRSRFMKGERTTLLYNEIMGIVL